MAVWSHSTWQRLEGVTNRNISYLQWLDPAVWHLKERNEKVWMSRSLKPFSCFGFNSIFDWLRISAVSWTGLPKTPRPHVSLSKTLVFCTCSMKCLFWHTGSPTPMFLSNTPRIISTGLVFWDWEGLLRWCRDMDWEKGRCKVIVLNTSIFQTATDIWSVSSMDWWNLWCWKAKKFAGQIYSPGSGLNISP